MLTEAEKDSIIQKIDKVRATFKTGKTKTLTWRLEQLGNVRRMVLDNKDTIIDALHKDLGRPKLEAEAYDIITLIGEIDLFVKNLHKWMQPEHTSVPAVMIPATAEVVHEPWGVALVIGAFNFPIVLLLSPLIGAIAAGNAVIAKPSEMSVQCEKFFSEMIPKYLDTTAIEVVCGAVETGKFILEQSFDKIFFTGSPTVGRIVMAAAAKNLTPVTLELGGKSPAIVDSSVTDMELVARRLAWGKFANVGQTCIAPDYVLCQEKVYDEFLAKVRSYAEKFYGADPETSQDYCRMVSQASCLRIQRILDDATSYGKIYFGGVVKPESRYVSPTVIIDLQLDSKAMTEELFGPVMIVLKYNSIDEVVDIVNAPCRKNPLALYIFGKNRQLNDRLINEIPSGGVLVNDCMFHYTNLSLPFGGRGNSGVGFYHGRHSYEAFSHRRSVMRRDDHSIFDVPVRYPPYTDFGLEVLKAAVSAPSMPSVTFWGFLWRAAVAAGVIAGVVAIAAAQSKLAQ